MTDREKLIELFERDDCPMFMVLGKNMEGLADFLIANGVTVQTPGEWIRPVPGDGAPRCSNCKKPPVSIVFDTGYWRYRETDFCPNCGARMKGEGGGGIWED